MRSAKLILILTIIAATCSQSCRKGSSWGIKGSGEKVTETKIITGFNAIDLSMDATVVYTQDSVYRVEVTAQPNILAVMDLKTDGEELTLDFKRNILSHDGITFVIHSPSLRKIGISGSGSFNVANYINGNNLDVNISGSGKISVPTVSLQSLDVDISGSGNLSVDGGTCHNEAFHISGSGFAGTEFVSAVTVNANISGSGVVTVNASDRISVDMSGSGTVKYRGRPVVETRISGSGKLIHID